MSHRERPCARRADLPHRELSEQAWQTVTQRLGWLTYEELVGASLELLPDERQQAFRAFFQQRRIVPVE